MVAMSRRGVVRNKMAVPVKILVTDPDGTVRSLLGCTLDASAVGARLGGVYEQLSIGQVVVVQYRHRRCQFLVRWIGASKTGNATQVGLECLEPGKNIWGIGFCERMMPASSNHGAEITLQRQKNAS